MISLSINNIDYLYYVLIPLFNNNMYSRKDIDFKLWKIVVTCHKLGYHLIEEGRNLIVLIFNNINNKRYTTTTTNNNNDNNIFKEIDNLYNKLLLTPPMININSTKSHLALVLEYTNKNKTNKTIYIYELKDYQFNPIQEVICDTCLIEGSPFKTYADANSAINLNRSSRTIYRYLDTNKLYKNKYLITSLPRHGATRHGGSN